LNTLPATTRFRSSARLWRVGRHHPSGRIGTQPGEPDRPAGPYDGEDPVRNCLQGLRDGRARIAAFSASA